MKYSVLIAAAAAAAASPALAGGNWPRLDLIARHGGEHHGSGGEHHGSGGASNDTQGVGHGHDMAHGAFIFTPSGIPWPQCLRDCCNKNFKYFPEPVNNPLCASNAFYKNVTTCVASNCTDYEQGAYAVVAEIECPKNEDYKKIKVLEALKSDGGKPQDCQGVNNATIKCANGTDVKQTPGTGAAQSLSASPFFWALNAALIAVPAALSL